MFYVTQIVLIVLALSMFLVPRSYKYALLIVPTICFQSTTLVGVPFGGGTYLLPHAFLLSELPNIVRELKRADWKSTTSKIVIVSIIAFIILFINSPHYTGLYQFTRLALLNLTAKYFAFAYASLCITRERDFLPAVKISFYALLVVTFFGVLNAVTRHAMYIDAVGSHMKVSGVFDDLGSKFTYSDRFRVQSMFMNPFNYGYICIILLLFHSYAYLQKMMGRRRWIISIVCCVFGVASCGCRTNLLCLLVAVSVFAFFAFKTTRWMTYALTGLLLFAISYVSVPMVQEKVDSMMTMFDRNSKVSGSSIEMREMQYAAVLYHIQGHELVGRGADFFNIDLGWGDVGYGKQNLVDKDLQGLEGVVMGYLLERGFVGLALYVLILYMIISYIYKNRKASPPLASLGLSCMAAYLVFANATGELSSAMPTFLMGGGVISCLSSKESW